MAQHDTGTIVAHVYAEALYDVAAEAGRVTEVEQELIALWQTLGADERFRRFLDTPTLTPASKRQVLRGVLTQFSAPVFNFLCLLIDNERTGALEQIVNEFHAHANLKAGVAEFKLRCVVPLENGEAERLKQVLHLQTGRQVSLKTELAPDLLGGFVLRSADKQWDVSLARRLAQLKEQLATGVRHAHSS